MMTEQELEVFRDSYESLMRFSARYRGDEVLRARLENGDYGDLHGEVPAGAEIRVLCQTPDVYYMLMPADPNQATPDRMLEAVAGGSTTGCAGSVLTAGTAPSCVSSVSTVGTASSREAQS